MSETAKPPLIAHIVVDDIPDALDFYAKAFAAEELFRMPLPDGSGHMHAEMRINGATVMLAETNDMMGCAGPKQIGGTPVTLHLNVPDVDAAYQKAVDAGCEAAMPPSDMFWGDRYGRMVDPFGHNWSLATHTKDMTPEEIAEAAKSAFADGG